MDSVRERDAAYQSIKADGVSMILSQNNQGSYNPENGSVTNTSTSHSTYGVVTDYRLSEIDGTLIKRSEEKIVLAVTATMPEPTGDDNLIISGVIWSIINSNPVAPAGVPILYILQVR